MEKSCGTVPFEIRNGKIYYLLTQARDDGYCGFPKGHVEKGESEIETAYRETWEETSVRPRIFEDFRVQVSYRMNSGRRKTVVYFLAEYTGQTPRYNHGFERLNYLILPLDEALEALTYENTREILKEADDYIKRNIIK